MWIEGDPDDEPVYDSDGNVLSAYGLQLGEVYGMKSNDPPQSYGGLDAPTGSGTNDWRNFVRGGCESDTGETLDACEGCEVEAQPGDWGNPVLQALEGGQGEPGLYAYEHDWSNEHLNCNLHLTINPDDFTDIVDVQTDPSGLSLDATETINAINLMTDPSLGSVVHPCGGLNDDGSVAEEAVTASVQGRLMQIVLTNGACNNSCDLPVLGILRMYIVCWTGQDTPAGGEPCWDTQGANVNPADTTIYGVFADFSAPTLTGGTGLGTNPLGPRHVVLVD
jgi:hypothetical protein